tara:strand:- start:438 stop:656 length:219 start_codon:yes stop_codon:yes gene_type:complete
MTIRFPSPRFPEEIHHSGHLQSETMILFPLFRAGMPVFLHRREISHLHLKESHWLLFLQRRRIPLKFPFWES